MPLPLPLGAAAAFAHTGTPSVGDPSGNKLGAIHGPGTWPPEADLSAGTLMTGEVGHHHGRRGVQ